MFSKNTCLLFSLVNYFERIMGTGRFFPPSYSLRLKFYHSLLFNRSEFSNKIVSNRALSVNCLIIGKKMTPILSENRDDVTRSPITASQLPYLASPQTPSLFFPPMNIKTLQNH